jgi:hypothetical protein
MKNADLIIAYQSIIIDRAQTVLLENKELLNKYLDATYNDNKILMRLFAGDILREDELTTGGVPE